MSHATTILQLADDTTLFAQKPEEASKLLKLLEEYMYGSLTENKHVVEIVHVIKDSDLFTLIKDNVNQGSYIITCFNCVSFEIYMVVFFKLYSKFFKKKNRFKIRQEIAYR